MPPRANKHDHDLLPAEGFSRLRAVLRVYPVSPTTWWRGVRNGKFPQPVKLSPGVTVWRNTEIRKLLAAADEPGA